jgi:Chloride channel protein EriC
MGCALESGIDLEAFVISEIPAFYVQAAIIISGFAILCALVSVLFCVIFRRTDQLYKRWFKNPYFRNFACGCFVVVRMLLVGNQNCNGAGMEIMEYYFEGDARTEAFLMKIIFTAFTTEAGYKGGEIVPLFFSGAAFGCLFEILSVILRRFVRQLA